MSRIIVTGGAGFIGTNLIRRLVKDGHDILSIDDYSSGLESNHIEGVEYNKVNINHLHQWNIQVDQIYHIAARARINPSFTEYKEYFEANVTGTHSVLEFAKKKGAKVVYAGSSSRHKEPECSPYANTKFMGEQLCKQFRFSLGQEVEIARFYNVYGPNELIDPKNGTVLGIWQDCIKNNNPIPIVGDGEQRRDFTHVDDIVDGLIKIMNSDKIHTDAWELGTGKNFSINQVADWFCDKFNTHRYYVDDRPGNYRETLRVNDDAKDKLGWNPQDRLKDYIYSL